MDWIMRAFPLFRTQTIRTSREAPVMIRRSRGILGPMILGHSTGRPNISGSPYHPTSLASLYPLKLWNGMTAVCSHCFTFDRHHPQYLYTKINEFYSNSKELSCEHRSQRLSLSPLKVCRQQADILAKLKHSSWMGWISRQLVCPIAVLKN